MEDIWECAQERPIDKHFAFKWPELVNEYQVYDGTIFFADTKEMIELNQKLDPERKINQTKLESVSNNIELYKKWRKEEGLWDDDDALFPKPKVDSNKKYYIKNVTF